MGVEYVVSASYGFFVENEELSMLFDRLGIPEGEARYDYEDSPTSLLSEKGFKGLEFFHRRHGYSDYPGWGVALSSSIVSFYPRSDDGMWALEAPTSEENEKALAELDRLEDLLFPDNQVGWTNTERLKRNWYLISSHH